MSAEQNMTIFLRQEGIREFHADNRQKMEDAKGSSSNHQAWAGGYSDHICQCLGLADAMYTVLNELSKLSFSRESVMKVLYFHDIEKIWKYTTGLPENFDKHDWYDRILPVRYNIRFTEEEINALRYVHGENEDYKGSGRVMSPLAAFCHSVDTISARIYHDKTYREIFRGNQ
jgi:hypothetical protein